MIIVMQKKATEKDINDVKEKIIKLGYKPYILEGVERSVIGAIGDERNKSSLQSLESMHGVEHLMPILKPYKLASREVKKNDTIIDVSGVKIGGKKIVIMAGPCSIESEKQILETGYAVKSAGAHIIRGGAFKPRTSPYAFQGLEEEGLKLLALAREKTGLPIITEVMNPQDVECVEKYSDILQVGARNVQNFSLLKLLGKVKKPILLKRGLMTTIKEFLMSAEYILASGNDNVILCERGIRTFETATRNTLDLSCIPVLKKESHLPIIVDPSHATGHWDYVAPLSFAAIAAGADGLMIEVHCCPEDALSDGPQSLKPEKFSKFMKDLQPFIKAAGRI